MILDCVPSLGKKGLTLNSLPCYDCGYAMMCVIFDASVDYIGKADLHCLSFCGSTLGRFHSDESPT